MTVRKSHRLEADTMWEVFARRAFQEPLHHVGTVAADNQDLAYVYARTIFDEFTWVEMVIFPRASAVQVIKT